MTEEPSSLLKCSLTVFDTETTGPDPMQDRVIEIGFVHVVDSQPKESASYLVNPGMRWERDRFVVLGQDGAPVTIPLGAFRVHGIAPADIEAQSVVFAIAWQACHRFLAGVTVGYNTASFDIPLIWREFVIARLESVWRVAFKPHVDLYPFIAWHYRHWRSRKLSDVCAKFDIRLGEDAATHSAAGDCLLTFMLMKKLVELGIVPENPAEAHRRAGQLSRALAEESRLYMYWFYEDRADGRLRMGAGRHRGKLAVDVPKKEWENLLKKATDAPDHIREMFRTFLEIAK